MEMSMPEVEGGAVAPAVNEQSQQTPQGQQPVSQTEGQTSESEQSAATGTAENEQEHTEQQQEQRKRNSFQRRLDNQKSARVAAETEARMLRERVAELEGRKQQATPASGGEKEPKRDDFESYEDFIEARATFRAEKKAAELVESRFKQADERRTKDQTEREHRELVKTWETSQEAARKELDDFDEVVGDSEAPTTQVMSRALMESPVGAKVLYHLAKNPAEAERIAKLSPTRQIAEIGKLEDKVNQKPATPKTPSKAPDPITPVGGSKSVANTSPNDTMPVGEWMQRRNAEVRGR